MSEHENPLLRGKRNQKVENAIDAACKGAWEGTRDIVEVIVNESRQLHAWRPVRAAALMAIRDIEAAGEDRIVMSAEEFKAWRKTALAVARERGEGNYLERVGLSGFQARGYSEKGATKMVGLACAHFLMGLPMPIEPGDARAFDGWYTPRFGAVDRVATWLGVSTPYLTARLKGFEVLKGVRYAREPEIYLIRALDWLWSVGPVCPYGRKADLQIWPGQDVGDDYG